MTSTSTPMDHGTPSPTPISDANGLERLFRERYTTLVDEAKVDLGAAAPSAPRVVETVFRQVWEERARFSTPDQVDKFLHESVHHGAARELSRRASVHRYDAKAGGNAHHATSTTASVDESWTRVAHALHFDGTTTNAVEAGRAAKEALRHDAAEHVAALAKPPAWKVPALIVTVAAALAIGGLYVSNRLLENRKIERALSDPEARTHQAASGQMAIVNLDDGTRVTLSPESRMIVPKQFGAQMRAVRVIGSARFTVAAGQATPFQVRALRTTATATGTDFTVRLAAGDSTVAVLVREGTVNVQVGDSSRVANVDRAVAVTNAGVLRDATADEKEELGTWTDGQLVIVNRQLREVLPELKRWYGLDLKVTDTPLLSRPVTVRASLDSPMSAIRSLENSGKLKFGYEDKTMVLRDAAPAKKK